MTNIDQGMKSLRGLWVGDCIGNMGRLYNVHDILKALEKGIQQYGEQLSPLGGQFNYSDDTEEAIVLYHHVKQHLTSEEVIDVDALAMEFATQFMKDPSGEDMGYGLMTRKVLKDIYNGVPWYQANKTFHKAEGMSSHVDDLVTSIIEKKTWHEVASEVRKKIEIEKYETRNDEKVGSCGNGAAMRVAPLGALLTDRSQEFVARAAAYSALPTHDHPEGIAGAMAVSGLAWKIANGCVNSDDLFRHILEVTPSGEVYNGLMKANVLALDAPLGKAIQSLGNGSHVTCQDTVPLCCWITIRGIALYLSDAQFYEKVITETAACQGDVDTTCAIVGGMIGTIAEPPAHWVHFCKPMEGVE